MTDQHTYLINRVTRLAAALDTAIQTLDYMGQDKVAEYLRQAFYDEPDDRVGVALRVGAAMRKHRADKPLAFTWRRQP